LKAIGLRRIFRDAAENRKLTAGFGVYEFLASNSSIVNQGRRLDII
jgi:hypothetical protein